MAQVSDTTLQGKLQCLRRQLVSATIHQCSLTSHLLFSGLVDPNTALLEPHTAPRDSASNVTLLNSRLRVATGQSVAQPTETNKL